MGMVNMYVCLHVCLPVCVHVMENVLTFLRQRRAHLKVFFWFLIPVACATVGGILNLYANISRTSNLCGESLCPK